MNGDSSGAETKVLFEIKRPFSMYGDFHYKDKTVVRSTYLYEGNPFTGIFARPQIISGELGL